MNFKSLKQTFPEKRQFLGQLNSLKFLFFLEFFSRGYKKGGTDFSLTVLSRYTT